jgi:hypothetical protein
MLAAPLVITPQVLSAVAAANFEKPPVLDVTQLVPAKLLKGQGFQVQKKVPTDGVMGTYTLIADKQTFGDDAGTYQVRSREMLELRLKEIPAIIKLDETSKTKTFITAMGTTAVKPLESAGRMVMHPIETASGLPGGVGRLFQRAGTGASHLWNTATNSEKGGLGEAAQQTGAITKDALGYEQERRQLAKRLGVDPYTTNPILKKKLDAIATVAFYGHVGVNTVISVAVPASMIITGVRMTDDLVWDTPRGDLIVRVEDKLQELQVPKSQISAFTHNPAIPLSLQVSLVENLARLANVPGRVDVVGLVASVETESQARFLATSLRMLVQYNDKKKPITALAAPGPLVGQDRDGMLLLPAPVDYVSWTERVASFAESPSFLEVSQRTIWLVGQMSPRAKKEFTARGWNVLVEAPP